MSRTMFLVPNPVQNLQARPKNTTSVEVIWSYPREAQSDYRYQVQVNGGQFNKTVDGNRTEISNLEPGTQYNIGVTVLAAAGSQSLEEQTYSYTSKTLHSNIWGIDGFSTKWLCSDGKQSINFYSQGAKSHPEAPQSPFAQSKQTLSQWDTVLFHCGLLYLTPFLLFTSVPKAVTDLKAESVTTTTISLTWHRQSDYKPSYSYLVIAQQQQPRLVYRNSTSDDSHTVSGLTPGKRYRLDVLTVVGGVNSSITSIFIQTSKLMKKTFKV